MNDATCATNQIDDFLENRLSEAEQSAFELHLDSCDRCCRELQRRTADADEWDKTRRFLSSRSSFDEQSDDVFKNLDESESHLTSHVHATDNRERPPSLDFLVPTDDPRMLGRFAGYEITGVVGCGGMGIVLKGFDSALNRFAAIKVLAPHFATSGAARQRFAREGQAAAAVVHDNVIAIHGVSEFNGLPYLVMPYVKGTSLQKRIDREGLLSIEEILRIAMQMSRGLSAAHDQGLVHRDIKPANILLPENVERVLITDFGLARAADDASLTRSGVIAGTPQYMSPEQARGEGIDHRSDLFSLGCVMYAMAAGHPPFRAETPYGILRRITDTAHRPLHEIRSDLPDWFCAIVDRLLQKKATDRFPSAHVVAAVIEDCLAHIHQPRKHPLPTGLNSSRNVSRFKLAALAIAAVILVGIIGFATYQLTSSRNQSGQGSDAAGTTNPSSNVLEPPKSDDPQNDSSVLPAVDESELRWESHRDLEDFEKSLKDLAKPLSR